MEDGPLYTNDDNYVFVMRIHRYLAKARAGAAANYLLTNFGVSNMVTARQIRKAASDPRQQDEILEVLANRKGLTRWTSREPATRAPMLHEIASAHAGTLDVMSNSLLPRTGHHAHHHRRLLRLRSFWVVQV